MRELQKKTDSELYRYVDPKDGTLFASPSTILDRIVPGKLNEWQKKTSYNKQAQVLQEAADIGTQFHLLVEADLRGETVPVPVGLETMWEHWKGCRDRHKIEAIDLNGTKMIETIVYSESLGTAGQVDAIVKFTACGSEECCKATPPTLYTDRVCVMDLKSGRYSIKAGMQMGGYKIMAEEMHGFRGLGIVGVNIRRDGSPAQCYPMPHEIWPVKSFICAIENPFKALNFYQLAKDKWPWLMKDATDVWHSYQQHQK